MTNLDRLIEIIGTKAKLAKIISRHPSQVTRFVRYGYLPVEHNLAVARWAEETGKLEALEYLEPVCPCCGKGVDRV